MAERLERAGMRPINNVVDVSNYVMLELGQPNHPYDLDRLPGQAFRIRRAEPGETMVTLDDVERTFTADDLLICDGDDTPIGVAGVMGGASSEIHDGTDVGGAGDGVVRARRPSPGRRPASGCARRPRRASSAASTRS